MRKHGKMHTALTQANFGPMGGENSIAIEIYDVEICLVLFRLLIVLATWFIGLVLSQPQYFQGVPKLLPTIDK